MIAKATEHAGVVDAQVWEVLRRLYHGPRPQPWDAYVDFAGRELVCTPYDGAYGRAGWVSAWSRSGRGRTISVVRLGTRSTRWRVSRPRSTACTTRCAVGST